LQTGTSRCEEVESSDIRSKEVGRSKEKKQKKKKQEKIGKKRFHSAQFLPAIYFFTGSGMTYPETAGNPARSSCTVV
jgi:hypothetical protein